MIKKMLENVRNNKPLIHNITNYVTVNDCANILLACGVSPIMSDDIDEVEEITTICSGLNINIGTLNSRTIKSMHKAGKKANELNHPVILDPVGAGASALRTNTAKSLIEEIRFSVIRGNVSEIKAIAGAVSATRGVDAAVEDGITAESLQSVVDFAKGYSRKTGAVIAITGAIDVVANSENAYCIFNGRPEMSMITGTGCQLSALLAAFAAANPNTTLEAAAAATALMGVAGELAYRRMKREDGNASYRDYIIDAVYGMTADILQENIKIQKF